MNRIAFFLFSLFASIPCFSMNFPRTEETLWQSLYNNEASLSHKLLLNRPVSSANDFMLTNFMFVYRAYKMGDEEQVKRMLEAVDILVKVMYIDPNEEQK